MRGQLLLKRASLRRRAPPGPRGARGEVFRSGRAEGHFGVAQRSYGGAQRRGPGRSFIAVAGVVFPPSFGLRYYYRPCGGPESFVYLYLDALPPGHFLQQRCQGGCSVHDTGWMLPGTGAVLRISALVTGCKSGATRGRLRRRPELSTFHLLCFLEALEPDGGGVKRHPAAKQCSPAERGGIGGGMNGCGAPIKGLEESFGERDPTAKLVCPP